MPPGTRCPGVCLDTWSSASSVCPQHTGVAEPGGSSVSRELPCLGASHCHQWLVRGRGDRHGLQSPPHTSGLHPTTQETSGGPSTQPGVPVRHVFVATCPVWGRLGWGSVGKAASVVTLLVGCSQGLESSAGQWVPNLPGCHQRPWGDRGRRAGPPSLPQAC